MNELPFIDDPVRLKLELRRLIALREAGKQPRTRGTLLSRVQRAVVHAKTDGRCHVCGELVALENFEADHVKNHTSGGVSAAENYLPACSTCNGYRWHYRPEELQWILKLGIWAKTQIDRETAVGAAIAKGFIAHEKRREARRAQPRAAQIDSEEPNKSPEPTATVVTPRAVEMKMEVKQSTPESSEARVAPAAAVAHL